MSAPPFRRFSLGAAVLAVLRFHRRRRRLRGPPAVGKPLQEAKSLAAAGQLQRAPWPRCNEAASVGGLTAEESRYRADEGLYRVQIAAAHRRQGQVRPSIISAGR